MGLAVLDEFMVFQSSSLAPNRLSSEYSPPLDRQYKTKWSDTHAMAVYGSPRVKERGGKLEYIAYVHIYLPRTETRCVSDY
jgi:hypothetical protein